MQEWAYMNNIALSMIDCNPDGWKYMALTDLAIGIAQPIICVNIWRPQFSEAE